MMNAQSQSTETPKDGWEGLKQNFGKDATSGFVVFLLALPLSLGIAGASGFPPVMGLLTAIIGGLFGTFFSGSQLSIKGPAAGLIVIVADCVDSFGGGDTGWKLALGVMVVAGIVQVIFGLLKCGKFVDLFPLSAVHGMLAAIGIIIIAKQIPVLLNVDPHHYKGLHSFEVITEIPQYFSHLDPKVSIIGGISLIIMLGWGYVKQPLLKKIPAPLLVLLFAIPTGMYLDLADNAPDYTLVKVGKIIDQVGFNVDMSGISMAGIFIKFVIMVSLVGSLESLLTVKAVDLLDPWKRKANTNKDLIGTGLANTLAGLLGGLPMISEVARSSANVAQGGRTRWSNFFHGLFLLISVLLAYQVLEMIPKAALAAMLISVGIKLAHPKEFIHMWKVGPEQLAIFITTIFFTLYHDLLVGIAAGMLLKVIVHLVRGAKFTSIFNAQIRVEEEGETITVHFGQAAVFTNYLSIKSELARLPEGKKVRLDFTETALVDHSVRENLELFKTDYTRAGGEVAFVNIEHLTPVTKYPAAALKRG